MPTFNVTHTYERTEEDIRRIAVDSEHPLESPYRQACIKWAEEHPAPLPNPNDFLIGTVFTHESTQGTVVEYVALGGTKFLRNQDGERGIRFRSRGFWNLSGVKIVFKP